MLNILFTIKLCWFQIPVKKYRNKAIFVPNWFFIFCYFVLFFYFFFILFFWFNTKLCILRSFKLLVWNMTIAFSSNSGLKYQNKAFWVPNVIRFVFATLQLDKFKGVDFKYGNSFFQIPVTYGSNERILVTNLNFFLNMKVCIFTNPEEVFSNMAFFFSNSSLKWPN